MSIKSISGGCNDRRFLSLMSGCQTAADHAHNSVRVSMCIRLFLLICGWNRRWYDDRGNEADKKLPGRGSIKRKGGMYEV